MVVVKAWVDALGRFYLIACARIFCFHLVQLNLVTDARTLCLCACQLLDPAQTTITIGRHDTLPDRVIDRAYDAVVAFVLVSLTSSDRWHILQIGQCRLGVLDALPLPSGV